MKQELEKIRRLVGPITVKELRYVDSFVSDNIGIFMPAGGPCYYALTPQHSHPSYMFVLPFNDQTSLRLNGKTIQGIHGKIFVLSPNTKRA